MVMSFVPVRKTLRVFGYSLRGQNEIFVKNVKEKLLFPLICKFYQNNDMYVCL